MLRIAVKSGLCDVEEVPAVVATPPAIKLPAAVCAPPVDNEKLVKLQEELNKSKLINNSYEKLVDDGKRSIDLLQKQLLASNQDKQKTNLASTKERDFYKKLSEDSQKNMVVLQKQLNDLKILANKKK